MLNSNISGEMVQLMILNQEKYVPAVKKDWTFEVIEPIFFDADALTEERARNIQWVFQDGDNQFDRIEGLDSVHTDWHAKVKLHEVNIYNYALNGNTTFSFPLSYST